MTIRTNPELKAILDAQGTQFDQVRALDTALTASKRIKAKRAASSSTPQESVWDSGTLFRDAALTGSMTISGVDITGYGVTSDLTTSLAADLSTGISVLRIEGGGHWIEGTLGLPGSGADFIFPVNPTASNSIAIGPSFKLLPNQGIPDGLADLTAPTASITLSASTITQPQSLVVTADVQDNKAVTKVEFIKDGSVVSTKTSAPWTYTDQIAYVNKGTRRYTAKAYDAAGNTGTSLEKTVTVSIPEPIETGPAVNIGSAITDFTVQNTSSSLVTNAPVTFAQPFKVGQLPASGAAVELRDASNNVIPVQLDVKAFHQDGSVRHAVLSFILPSLNGSGSITYSIVRKTASGTPSPAVPSDFPGLGSVVTITDGGSAYTASLATLLAGARNDWLSGDVVSEWEVSSPLKKSDGTEHPHLHVRFCARAYKGQNKARVDITVENTWAWDLTPQDVNCDVVMTVGGNQVYSKTGLVHHPRTRYRNIFWWNASEPTIHIKHNIDYLIATKAVPNYDRTIVPNADAAAQQKEATLTKGGPMGSGLAQPAMGTTGGRPDIGILPGWTALYIISMFKDSKDAVLNQGNLGGSWPAHFRDRNTDRVLSFNDYPYYSVNGSSSDAYNPATGKSEKAPSIVTNTNINQSDISHHPDFAYVPYLVTGDLYYLEELQFWAQTCGISQNPADSGVGRRSKKSLFFNDQLRGQAWALRSISHAAYISPPGVKKTEFEYILKSNIDWYDERYTNSTAADTKLGAFVHGFGIVIYPATTGDVNGISVFQEDHFTAALGRSIELGYIYGLPLLNWKSKFTVGRLYGISGVCWIQAAAYYLRVRDTSTSPIYSTLKECYDKTMSPAVIAAAQASNCATQSMADAWRDFNTWRTTVSPTRYYMDGVSNPQIGDMDGYSDSTTGYPSCLQQAISYIASYGLPNSNNAWEVLNGRTVKPNYGSSPQFAIVPRT